MRERDKRTKTVLADELAQKINTHLKRFENSSKINRRRGTEGTLSYYCVRAVGDRHRVWVVYINYQGGDHLSIEDATKYLAWLDAGNIGRHFEALQEPSK